MKEKNNQSFWNKYAKLYDFEINRFNKKAYEKMYQLMASALTQEMDVLEIATGTGLIAIHIAPFAHSVLATDFAPSMIDVAKKKPAPSNVHFTVEDATMLSYPDQCFDAVIISNALHVMPDPVLVLENIKRVLKPNGLLIAPTFSQGHKKVNRFNKAILDFIGFKAYAKWLPEEYTEFLVTNGLQVHKLEVLHAAFPLMYVEARFQK